MAVISKEELVNAVTSRLGETPDDEGLNLLENLTDTLNSYEAVVNLDFENERKAWEEERSNFESKIKELDDSWRKRYTERFNQPVEKNNEEPFVDKVIDNSQADAESIDIKDLFTEREE